MKPVQRWLNFANPRSLHLQRQAAVPVPLPLALPEKPDMGPNVCHKVGCECGGLGHPPYPYQKKGIEWLMGHPRALLADEMGLGKTVQWLRSIPAGMPAIVVCPASLRLLWRDECLSWRPDLSPVVCPPGEFTVPTRGELAIMSYESLPDPPKGSTRFLVADAAVSRCALGVDEAQMAKSISSLWSTAGSQRAKKVALLARQCQRVTFMTGTPMLGKPKDLWGVLMALGVEQEVFGDRRRRPYDVFVELFGAERKKYGSGKAFWQFPTEARDMPGLDEVRKRVGRVALRRLRKDVLKNLPGKTYQEIPVQVSPELSAELDSLAENWVDQDELPPFELWSRVRQKLAQDRIPTMLEWVERYEEEETPLVVWSAHRAPIEAFAGRQGWGVVLGGMGNELVRTQVEAFQAGLLSGIALTIGAGGTGINLSRAAHELFVDLAQNPSENAQAEDRLPRPGQKAEGIVVMRMVADHAVDRHILEILDRKQRLIAATTGGTL